VIDKEFNLPFYAKGSLIIIGLFVLTSMLYIGQSIIVPVVFAVIIAIVLHPVVNFFVRHKLPRVVAIVITLLLTFLVVAAIGTLIVNQASQFSDSWPILVDKFTLTLNQTMAWISGYFDIKPKAIHAWVIKARVELLANSNAAIGQTLFAVGNGLIVLFLIPVYVFLMLFYHRLLIDFIHKLFVSSDQSQVSTIVNQTKTLIQRYLVGLVIEAVIVAILEIAALLILGVDYAILLGVLGALLNVIPYIGGLVAVALPMLVAFATKDSAWYPVYILIIYYVIQLIDNNYIVPIIVSSKVKINALASIIVVIAGNALWGVPGMFLSIPLLAIIKLIFDNIESLKPWGFLLGDNKPIKLGIKPPGIKQIKKILKSV
jgi:predicted PurR-regulated permease PerM